MGASPVCMKHVKCVVCDIRCPVLSECGSDCPFKDLLPLSPSQVAHNVANADGRVRQLVAQLDGTWNHEHCLEQLSIFFCLSKSRLSHRVNPIFS